MADTSAPGTKLIIIMGTMGEEVFEDGKRKLKIVFDLLPGQSFTLDATSLKYEGSRTRQRGQVLEELPGEEVEENQEKEDSVFINDAVDEESQAQDKPSAIEEEIDLCWEAGEQTTDARLARPEDAFHGRCSVRVARGSSLARYFLAFLPVQHLGSVVIPAINLPAATLIANWSPVTLPEYLTCIELFILMSTMVIPGQK